MLTDQHLFLLDQWARAHAEAVQADFVALQANQHLGIDTAHDALSARQLRREADDLFAQLLAHEAFGPLKPMPRVRVAVNTW